MHRPYRVHILRSETSFAPPQVSFCLFQAERSHLFLRLLPRKGSVQAEKRIHIFMADLVANNCIFNTIYNIMLQFHTFSLIFFGICFVFAYLCRI